MKVNDTGFIISAGKNPRTNDCFWQAQVLKVEGEKAFLRLEDEREGWMNKSEFTPLYMRSNFDCPCYSNQATGIKHMKVETVINLQGTVVTITTSDSLITLTKGAQFEDEMANTIEVIVDDKDMTLAQARRKEMHDKLDNWIDGVEE